MNIFNSGTVSCILLISLVITLSCNSPSKADIQKTKADVAEAKQPQNANSQIAEYVVEIFEDSKGDLWFGTIPNGAARYDGKTLTYFSTKDGLIGNVVTSFAEDKDGNLWIGTHSGLSKYDGKIFTNFTDKDGLINNTVSNLLVDKTGNVWVGTWEGVSKLNGTTFSNFPIPKPEVTLLQYNAMSNVITEIIEDKQGNIWFSRDGYGVCKYDGKSFTHFTKKDGLASNNVQVIREDKDGNLWFGSRVAEKDNPNKNERIGDGGLTKFDGKTFTQFPTIKGLSQNDVYAICIDCLSPL